jgi:RNA polymerase sigma factor (sigma-70 family)
VIGLCFRHTGEEQEALDLAQEIFLRVFQKIESFNGRAMFSSWLYRVALNLCFNRHRRLKAKGRNKVFSLDNWPEQDRKGLSLKNINQRRYSPGFGAAGKKRNFSSNK